MAHREAPGRLSEVYAVVLDYVCGRWGVDEADVVRPFWPGGDFESFEYPEGCVVVDNPPFSILARIQVLPRARHRTLDNESGPQSTCALRPATNSGGPSRIRTCNLGIMSPSR